MLNQGHLTITKKKTMNYEDCKFYKHKHDENRWKYQDDDGIFHLIHKGVEVAKGVHVHSYDFNCWKYRDKLGTEHLIHEGVEVASGEWIYSYDLNHWEYNDLNGNFHEVKK